MTGADAFVSPTTVSPATGTCVSVATGNCVWAATGSCVAAAGNGVAGRGASVSGAVRSSVGRAAGAPRCVVRERRCTGAAIPSSVGAPSADDAASTSATAVG